MEPADAQPRSGLGRAATCCPLAARDGSGDVDHAVAEPGVPPSASGRGRLEDPGDLPVPSETGSPPRRAQRHRQPRGSRTTSRSTSRRGLRASRAARSGESRREASSLRRRRRRGPRGRRARSESPCWRRARACRSSCWRRRRGRRRPGPSSRPAAVPRPDTRSGCPPRTRCRRLRPGGRCGSRRTRSRAARAAMMPSPPMLRLTMFAPWSTA